MQQQRRLSGRTVVHNGLLRPGLLLAKRLSGELRLRRLLLPIRSLRRRDLPAGKVLGLLDVPLREVPLDGVSPKYVDPA